MKSHAQIAAQIAKLVAQERKMRLKHDHVVLDIIKQMKKNQITLSELRKALRPRKVLIQSNRRSVPVAKAVGKQNTTTKGSKLTVKYSDGAGNSWSGRGRPPNWVVTAEKSGRARAEFLV